MRRKLSFEIPPNYDGKKVGTFLRREKKMSARLLHSLKMLPDGILCNGAHIRTIDSVHTGDLLSVTFPEETAQSASVPVQMPLSVLYEDADLLVLNKSGSIAMHETHNHQGDALSNGVAYYLQSKGEPAVFRSVGRLDKGTSGVVVCAKHAYAAAVLSGQIRKEYLAVALGRIDGSGTICKPIYRPDPNKTLRAVGESGEAAVTHWTVLQHTADGSTLLHIRLETGRTHQIRVHFQSIGHPLVGDDMYGAPPDGRLHRQALHCAVCRLRHPVSGKEMVFSAPLPPEMQALLF